MSNAICPYCRCISDKEAMELLKAHHEVISSCAAELCELHNCIKRLEARIFPPAQSSKEKKVKH